MNAKVTINSPLTAERSPNSLLNMTGPCRLGAADLTQKPETSCHDDEEVTKRANRSVVVESREQNNRSGVKTAAVSKQP